MEGRAPSRAELWLSRALAVVLPAIVLAVGADALTSGQSRDARRQLENAGQLLNGKTLRVPVSEAIQKQMAKGPNLVLLGNSFANTNVDIGLLGSLLGTGRGSAARLSIPNTIGAHWYALLKFQVFRKGNTPPDVVLIVSDLQSALLDQPLSEGSFENLRSLMTARDAEIDKRVEMSGYVWETVQANRTRLRRTAINAVRDNAARAVLPMTPKNRVKRATNEAMERVFHASKTDLSLFRSALPVSVGQEETQIDLSTLPAPRDSFLPEIAKLCHEHGARLVMVRNKESPMMPPGRGDIVPAPLVREARAAIEPWGGLLLDMAPVPMVDAHYDNLDHMTPDGSRRFTMALAEALTDLGIADERERYVRPSDPARVELPEAGPLGPEAIRRSWTALPAGSTARWSWDEPWPGPSDTFRVRAVLEPMEAAGPPTLRVGAHEAVVQALPSGRWLAELVAPAPTEPWDLVIAAPGATVLEGLEVGTGSTPLFLSGYRPDVRGHRLELLGRFEVFGGELYRDAVAPAFASPPPRLPPLPRFQRSTGPTVAYDAGDLVRISDTSTPAYTPLEARCSPVRVSEDGVPLPLTNVGCKEAREYGKGRMCHTERRVLFSATDGTLPGANGRRYAQFLDPARACDGGFWLYPGDHATLAVPPDRLRELRDGVDHLELDVGIADRTLPIDVRVQVRVNGSVRAERTLSDDDGAGAIRVALEPPIRPDDTVELVFDNPTADSWAIVNRAALVPAPPPWAL
ncbi:MAG: hypothetical protein R3F61_12125 [Myxococcota bacterium]